MTIAQLCAPRWGHWVACTAFDIVSALLLSVGQNTRSKCLTLLRSIKPPPAAHTPTAHIISPPPHLHDTHVVHESCCTELAVIRIIVVPNDLIPQVNGRAATAQRIDHVAGQHLGQQQAVDAQAGPQRLTARAQEVGGFRDALGTLPHAHLQQGAAVDGHVSGGSPSDTYMRVSNLHALLLVVHASAAPTCCSSLLPHMLRLCQVPHTPTHTHIQLAMAQTRVLTQAPTHLAAALIGKELAPCLAAPHAHDVPCVGCLVLPAHRDEIVTPSNRIILLFQPPPPRLLAGEGCCSASRRSCCCCRGCCWGQGPAGCPAAGVCAGPLQALACTHAEVGVLLPQLQFVIVRQLERA